MLQDALFEFFPVGLFLIFLACHRKNTKPLYAMVFLFAAITLSSITLMSPHIFFFSNLYWNWQGKLLDFIWPWVIVYGLGWLTAQEIGLTLPEKRSDFKIAIYLGLGFVLLAVILSSILEVPTNKHVDLETILFQLTMPGLAEEITFRGVFLAILNRYLGKQWKIGDTRFGWGIILITIAFVCSHFYRFDQKTHQLMWSIDYVDIPMLVFAGILLGGLREKSGSIWPCVLFHNLMNGLYVMMENIR